MLGADDHETRDSPRPMGTLTPYVTEYVRARRAARDIAFDTARGQEYELRRFAHTFGNRPLAQLTAKAVDRWLAEIAHLAPSTRRSKLSTVRGFCLWLVDEGHIDLNPTSKIKRIRQPRSVPRALRWDDVSRLMGSLPDQRARAICALMVGLGLRCVEVERAGTGDYDPRAGTLRVVGKGGHERVLPVPREVSSELDRYLGEVGMTPGPLIRSQRQPWRGIDAGTLSNYMAEWMRAAGVKHSKRDGVSAHALRHTAASDVLDRCGDLRVVQEMLGHAQLATTSIYLRRANLGQMRDAMSGRDYRAGREGEPVRTSWPDAA